MPSISYFRHLIRAVFYQITGNYDMIFDAFIKMTKHNMSPNSKFINYDLWIKNITEKIIEKKFLHFCSVDVSTYPKKNCILNTELYDNGGHTELVLRYLQQNQKTENIFVYLTNIKCRENNFFEQVEKCKAIENLSEGYYVSSKDTSMTDKIFEAYNYIIDNKITNVICNFHMQDAVSCAVLYMLKKYTNIEIDFWNHGDHYFSLGTTFADRIYTRVKDGCALTPYLKNNKKVVAGNFVFDNNINHYDNELFDKKRSEFGIRENAFITITGCNYKKVGEEYFKMIKKMLEVNKNIYHIFVCTIDKKEKQKIINKYRLSERFIITDFIPNFDFYIQLSDLYIDSFPQGSALTLVDFIKHSKPVVIKVNEKEPVRSFEEYLYENYEYAFKTSKGMLNGILELAENKDKYNEISQKVQKFFEEKYVI